VGENSPTLYPIVGGAGVGGFWSRVGGFWSRVGEICSRELEGRCKGADELLKMPSYRR
ncbi:hypothetical protein CEP51_007419, partial [Fusarium floridanum]